MDCRCADGIGGLCGYETGYFKGRVNEATEEMVAKRYVPPHQIEQREGDPHRPEVAARGGQQPDRHQERHDHQVARGMGGEALLAQVVPILAQEMAIFPPCGSAVVRLPS